MYRKIRRTTGFPASLTVQQSFIVDTTTVISTCTFVFRLRRQGRTRLCSSQLISPNVPPSFLPERSALSSSNSPARHWDREFCSWAETAPMHSRNGACAYLWIYHVRGEGVSYGETTHKVGIKT
eukprot:1245791-Ditylum_brightwellii.AAC.1